jgi:hypothetical protein
MALVTIPWQPSRKDLRGFAILQAVFFTAIAALGAYRGHNSGWMTAVVAASLAVGVIGVLRPAFVRWYYVGWMVAVYPIGWVVSHLVMAIAYFGVVTPIGWWLRWRGYDPLSRRIDPEATTYWKARPPAPEPSRYFRQF